MLINMFISNLNNCFECYIAIDVIFLIVILRHIAFIVNYLVKFNKLDLKKNLKSRNNF